MAKSKSQSPHYRLKLCRYIIVATHVGDDLVGDVGVGLDSVLCPVSDGHFEVHVLADLLHTSSSSSSSCRPLYPSWGGGVCTFDGATTVHVYCIMHNKNYIHMYTETESTTGFRNLRA